MPLGVRFREIEEGREQRGGSSYSQRASRKVLLPLSACEKSIGDVSRSSGIDWNVSVSEEEEDKQRPGLEHRPESRRSIEDAAEASKLAINDNGHIFGYLGVLKVMVISMDVEGSIVPLEGENVNEDEPSSKGCVV